MASNNEIGALTLVSLILLSSLVLAETSGTINMSLVQNSANIVTGLRGETMPTTTSTTIANDTGASGGSDIVTPNSTTTTTVAMTTTTIAGALPYDHYSAGLINNNYSASLINSTLANTSAFAEAVAKYIGQTSAIDMAASANLNSEISIIKSIDIYSNSSHLDVRIFFNGSVERTNVLVYDMVPKAFAQNAGNITVETALNYTVVEQDPTFMFFIPSLKQNDMISINYVVNKKVSPSVVNSTSISVFAGPQGGAWNIWYLAGAVVIIIVAAAAFVLVRIGVISFGEPKKPSGYKVQQAGKAGATGGLKDTLEKIKKKLFGKKIDRFSFRYAYKK